MRGTTTASLPPVNLNATKFTLRLGDIRLPKLRDLPAAMALHAYVNMLLGAPTERETTTA